MKNPRTKRVEGWTMPAYETHYPLTFANTYSGNNYQRRQKKIAFRFCGTRQGHAIDIGANIGLWSRDMCKHFDYVTLFEPDRLNRVCLADNLKHRSNWVMHPYGLYSEAKSATLFGGRDTCGNKSITKEAIQSLGLDKSEWMRKTKCELRVLDEFALTDVDFIKLDTQGSELEILKGSVDTIARCEPIICVEVTTKHIIQIEEAKVIHEFFESIGYEPVGGIKKDKLFMKHQKRRPKRRPSLSWKHR